MKFAERFWVVSTLGVDMRTHYDNLQVSPTASAEVIRASYRALIQKYHPDKFEDAARGARITQIINDAYAVLSDPARRAAYDARVAAARQGASQQEAREPTAAAPSPSPPAEAPAAGPARVHAWVLALRKSAAV